MQTATHTSGIAYDVPDGAWDEAFQDDGTPRPHYAALLAALGDTDLEDVDRWVRHDLRSRGAVFRGADGEQEFRIDVVPRLIEAGEWADVSRGLAQRVRALNAFIADAYGDHRIVEAGRVPARVIESAVQFERDMLGVPVPRGIYAHAAGLDLVRCEDGRLHVLEDNVRTPSGYTYLLAARDVLDERLPPHALDAEVESVADIVEILGGALRAAAPEGVDEPSVCLLSDGPSNSAWWEHEGIARELAIPIVTLSDLSFRQGRVTARVGDDERPVDVLYRRTDEDALRTVDGRPTPLADALLEPLRAGAVTLFNGFGAGVADDKLTHAYVEEMVRFYLDEEPLLPSVETLDLAQPESLAKALDQPDAMVFKERAGSGGFGVTVFAHARLEDQQAVLAELRKRPHDFIAQRRVTLSTHPTAIDGRLAPRHVDLRPFVLHSGDGVHVIPGGLTRVAFGAGALVVNSSQNGGGKDTWVLK